MKQYAFFKFFDKHGKPLNFTYDDVADKWDGQIYFDQVSAGLFENEQIFILEEVRTAVLSGTTLAINSKKKYTYPILWNNPAETSPDGKPQWCARWENDDAINQIYLYGIQNQRVVDRQGNTVDEPFINPLTPAAVYGVDQDLETQHYILVADWLSVPGNIAVSDGPIPAGIKILVRTCGPTSPGGDFNLDYNLDWLTGADSMCDDDIGPIVPPDFNDDFNDDFLISDVVITNDPWLNDPLDSRCLQFNVLLNSESEDIYERPLLLDDLSFATPWNFARILFWGETIGEDERFRLTLENFGRSFDQADAFLSREFDIKEEKPDWIHINEKRKQLLLAGDEIFPYLGSYRGLVNAIRFFGYQDLRIKEYWLNIDMNSPQYGKYLQYQINGLLSDDDHSPLQHPLAGTGAYRKTAKFGLFYDITIPNGETDEWGTPVTVDADIFTPEEVLIKLFALKNRLMREFLPLDARIVDIVGEGIYFSRIGVRSWEDEVKIIPLNINERLDFECYPRVGYVRDIRRFRVKRFGTDIELPVDRFTNTVNPYTMGQQYKASELAPLIESIQDFYGEINTFPFPYNGQKEWAMLDEEGVLAGCPVILTANLNSFTWDDMRGTWDQFAEMTWDNIDFRVFYEVEWIIEKGGDLPYYFSIRGKVDEYNVLPHFLPYTGLYTVKLKLYNLYNSYSIDVQLGAIEVLPREIEIAALCRFRSTEDYSWDGVKDLTWDDLAASTWYFPIEGTSAQDNPVLQELTNFARYRNQEDFMILNESTGLYEDYMTSQHPRRYQLGTRFLCWDGLQNLSWDQMYHSTWDMMDYHGDFLGGFKIYDPQPGDYIQIDDWPGHLFSPAALTLQDACDELNASTDPGIALFQYVVRHQPLASPTLSFIHAAAKMPGADGWRFVNMVPASSPGIHGATHSFVQPTWLYYQYDDPNFDFLGMFPSLNPDMTFVDQLSHDDTVSGASDSLAYWQQAGFLKTEDPTPEFPLGERRGHLPCWNGTGMFTNDLRVYTGDFEVPVGVPLFFVCNHSEIPGKTDFHWKLINEQTGELVIDVKGKNFVIFTFDESAQYSIYLSLKDNNGNYSETYKKAFVNVRARSELGTPMIPITEEAV